MRLYTMNVFCSREECVFHAVAAIHIHLELDAVQGGDYEAEGITDGQFPFGATVNGFCGPNIHTMVISKCCEAFHGCEKLEPWSELL